MGDEWWEFEEETKRVRRKLRRGERDREYREEKLVINGCWKRRRRMRSGRRRCKG